MGAERICLCYADNCPCIYYSVSSVESNQRPNTGNKTNSGSAWTPAPALVTSLGSLMLEPEPLKWSVTSSSESRLMPIVGLIQDSSGYEAGLLANQGKILLPIFREVLTITWFSQVAVTS